MYVYEWMNVGSIWFCYFKFKFQFWILFAQFKFAAYNAKALSLIPREHTNSKIYTLKVCHFEKKKKSVNQKHIWKFNVGKW